ncbi:hypothetical protein [Streptomyces sp. NPDC088812]|uniref:hypothetical protein n=1 Tax=Streptomyces sp. NPDC088812 TaxID=3365905 RepID=UPI003813E500
MDALRIDLGLGTQLRVRPADGLAERVRTAYFDRPGNWWRLCLNADHVESEAYAFYLRALSPAPIWNQTPSAATTG